MGGVYQAPVGSFANEFVLWKTAGGCEFFQSVERLEGGWKSEAPGSVWGRTLGVEEREYNSSVNKNVQGVHKPLRYDTDR